VLNDPRWSENPRAAGLSSIFSVADDRLKAGFVPMRQLVHESFPKIEQLFEQKRLITGVPTGFVDLDEMTRGSNGA